MSGTRAKFKAARDQGDNAAAQAIIDQRRKSRMQVIDTLSPGVKECVHDYGWKVVDAFLAVGVTKARHIRHLVETVLDEFSPTRGSRSSQGTTPARGMGTDR